MNVKRLVFDSPVMIEIRLKKRTRLKEKFLNVQLTHLTDTRITNWAMRNAWWTKKLTRCTIFQTNCWSINHLNVNNSSSQRNVRCCASDRCQSIEITNFISGRTWKNSRIGTSRTKNTSECKKKQKTSEDRNCWTQFNGEIRTTEEKWRCWMKSMNIVLLTQIQRKDRPWRWLKIRREEKRWYFVRWYIDHYNKLDFDLE